MRSNGGFLGPKKAVSTSAASGIWSLAQAQQEKGNSNWTRLSVSVQYVIAAGGGGGSGGNPNIYGAGGSAGQVLEGTAQISYLNNYSLSVGAGGDGGGFGGAGGVGTVSTGFSLTATGGAGASPSSNGTSGSGASGSGSTGITTNITGSNIVLGVGGAGGALNGAAGTGNTGNGGGGSYNYNAGAGGGSGVIYLRYLTADGTITIGAGLTGTTATDGSYKVTSITAGTGNVSWA